MATSDVTLNSLAAAVSVAVENVRFISLAETLPRKYLLFAQANPDWKDEKYETGQLYPVSSAEEVGNRFGFGYEIHRLAKWAFAGSQGVETWVLIDLSSGDPAVGNIQITANGVLAGTLHLYISGEYISVRVNDDDDEIAIEAAIIAAINENKTLFVVASTSTMAGVDLIGKNDGIYGEFVKISFNEGFAEEFPIGVSVTVVQPTGSTGGLIPTDSNFFNILGIDDEQNELYFTDLVISTPNLNTTILNNISSWNGTDNNFVGNYAKTVQRPLRCLHGDTTAGDIGYNNLIALGDNRKGDRTNGVIAVPGSPNHPQEIAALMMGVAAKINNQNAAESYINEVLQSVWAGAPEDRWTSNYLSRGKAIKSGISPTLREDGAIKAQNLITFYHPDNVPAQSNGYRSMRAIAVLQNISNSVKVNFKREKWQRISIVENVENVTDINARLKVKDKRAVEDDIVALVREWENLGWIYSANFTIVRIRTGQYVQVRAGGTGFNVVIPIILSGEAWIIDSLIQFDTAFTVFTQ